MTTVFLEMLVGMWELRNIETSEFMGCVEENLRKLCSDRNHGGPGVGLIHLILCKVDHQFEKIELWDPYKLMVFYGVGPTL